MIKTNKFKNFAGVNFLIKEVYNPYFAGWIDTGDKKIHRVFKKFGKNPAETLINGTEDMEASKIEFEKGNTELREQIWNKELKQFEFHKVKDKIDRDFFKTWKKVFDIEIETENPVEAEVYSNGSVTKEDDVSFRISEIPASRVKQMIDVLVDDEIPTEQREDRTGNMLILPIYDYEDSFKDKLKGKYAKFKVTGSGMDTKYTFLPGKEFSVADLEDIISNKSPIKKVVDKQGEIDIDSIPF